MKKISEKQRRASIRNIQRWEHKQMVGYISLGILIGGAVYCLTQIIIKIIVE